MKIQIKRDEKFQEFEIDLEDATLLEALNEIKTNRILHSRLQADAEVRYAEAVRCG